MATLFWHVLLILASIGFTGSSTPGKEGTALQLEGILEISEGTAPEPHLHIIGLGNGYSSPALTATRLYVTGEIDSLGYLMAFDWEGNEIWRRSYGPEWTNSFQGSRAAPVADQQRVYVCSGFGSLICCHAQTGEELWRVDMVNDLGGRNVTYGYSMPVLIDGDLLFCSPGGLENNVVALDKNSGQLIWSSPGTGETAGYGKPLLIHRGEIKILMTFSEFTFLGLNADTGEVLWTFDLNFKGELPCNPPVYEDGIIYIVAGPGNGAVALQLSADGKSIMEKWENMEFDSFFGGFAIMKDYLVGSADSKRSCIALDKRTGKIRSEIRFGKSATLIADNVLIAYNQRGQLGFITMENGKLRLNQEFSISEGTGEHFAVPVIYQNKLLIRHGSTLIGYQL